MKIHVAVVSDQTLANLIPILMARPDKVYLVCSNAMRTRRLDARIKRLLEQEAIGVHIKWDAPNAGLKSIQDYARSLATEIRQTHPDAEITLNATGGTKLMSLGFVEVFRELACAIIYTDTSHRCIEMFPDGCGAALPPEPMRNVLNVARYLAAQGFQYLCARSDDAAWCERVSSRKAASKYLGKEAHEIEPFIGIINRLADNALGREVDSDVEVLREPIQSFNRIPRWKWATGLDHMARAGLVDWRAGECQIQFRDTESALFLRGGWLEEYAWHVVKDEGVGDVRCCVDVSADGAPRARNEFDVLACHSNELLVIECKTLRYQEGRDSQIAYKIDSLGQQARGLFGETWLLSARQPTDNLLERARLARIRIIGPTDLPDLALAVQEWMKGPNEPEPLPFV